MTERYQILEGYQERQTIIKILDSDNEEDQIEIEKNKRVYKQNLRLNSTPPNFNAKIKKRYQQLPWFFDRESTPRQNETIKDQYSQSKMRSPNKKRFQNSQTKYNSNTLRYSQVMQGGGPTGD